MFHVWYLLATNSLFRSSVPRTGTLSQRSGSGSGHFAGSGSKAAFDIKSVKILHIYTVWKVILLVITLAIGQFLTLILGYGSGSAWRCWFFSTFPCVYGRCWPSDGGGWELESSDTQPGREQHHSHSGPKILHKKYSFLRSLYLGVTVMFLFVNIRHASPQIEKYRTK